MIIVQLGVIAPRLFSVAGNNDPSLLDTWVVEAIVVLYTSCYVLYSLFRATVVMCWYQAVVHIAVAAQGPSAPREEICPDLCCRRMLFGIFTTIH